jgi:hypothetical protein
MPGVFDKKAGTILSDGAYLLLGLNLQEVVTSGDKRGRRSIKYDSAVD